MPHGNIDFSKFVREVKPQPGVSFPTPYGLRRGPRYRMDFPGGFVVWLPDEHSAFVRHLNQRQPRNPKELMQAEADFRPDGEER